MMSRPSLRSQAVDDGDDDDAIIIVRKWNIVTALSIDSDCFAFFV